MKFSPVWYVVFGLAAVIIFLILTDNDKELNHEKVTALELALAISDKDIKELEDIDKRKTAAHAQEMALMKDSLAASRKDSRKLASNLERLKRNPIVLKVADSIPEIDSTLRAYESLLGAKDFQLEVQTRLITKLEIENKRITENFSQRLSLTQDQFEAQKRLTEEYKKDLRKQRRKVKLFKIVAVVGAVGGLFLGAGL